MCYSPFIHNQGSRGFTTSLLIAAMAAVPHVFLSPSPLRAAGFDNRDWTSTPAPRNSLKERQKAIQWLLRIGAQVTLQMNGKVFVLRKVSDIPNRSFDVESIVILKGELKELVSESDLSELSFFTEVRKLLIDFKLSTAGSSFLRAMPHVEELDLLYGNFNDEILNNLRSSALRKLSIRFNKSFTGATLQDWPGLSALESLNLEHTGLTDRTIQAVGICGQLECLVLNRTEVGDPTLRSLTHLLRLSRLEVAETKVSEAGLAAIAGLPHLEKLALGRCENIPHPSEALRQLLPGLQECTLWLRRGDVSSLGGLASLGTLRSLTLKADEIESLPPLHALRELQIESDRYSPEVMRTVNACKKLESLEIGGSGFSDVHLDKIQTKNLRYLGLYGTLVTHLSPLQLDHLRDLRHIRIRDSAISHSELLSFASRHPRIRILR
jgi:hypothetical protein